MFLVVLQVPPMHLPSFLGHVAHPLFKYHIKPTTPITAKPIEMAGLFLKKANIETPERISSGNPQHNK